MKCRWSQDRIPNGCRCSGNGAHKDSIRAPGIIFDVGECKHEIFALESFNVPAHGLFQNARFHLVERRKVEVEHHALAAYFVDFALDRSEFFHRFGSK